MNAIKKKEKRELKGYKIKDSIYQKAKRRAKKDKNALSTLVETWVTSYSAGYNIVSEVPEEVKTNNNA